MGSCVGVLVGVANGGVSVGVSGMVGVALVVGSGESVGVAEIVGTAVNVGVGRGDDVGLLIGVGVAVSATQTPEPMHAARNTGMQLRPQLPATGCRHDVIGTVH